jgi:hypothetical protein
MQPVAGFWAFIWLCIKAAEETTRAFFGLNMKTVVSGVLVLIVGFLFFRYRRGHEAAKTKVEDYFIFSLAPLGGFVALLFVYNLIRSPYLVYTAEFAKAKQSLANVQQHANALEQEKATLVSELAIEKDKSQPKFELGWGTSILGNDVVVRGNHKERHTHIFLPVTVLNHGAPSIIKGLRVTAKLKDGQELEGSAFIPSQPEFVFHMPDESLKFSTSASLAVRGTANPIPTGGQVDGYVFYEFPPDILKELGDPATLFILQVTDIAGNTYQGRITMAGPKPTQMSTSPGLLPLH